MAISVCRNAFSSAVTVNEQTSGRVDCPATETNDDSPFSIPGSHGETHFKLPQSSPSSMSIKTVANLRYSERIPD